MEKRLAIIKTVVHVESGRILKAVIRDDPDVEAVLESVLQEESSSRDLPVLEEGAIPLWPSSGGSELTFEKRQ